MRKTVCTSMFAVIALAFAIPVRADLNNVYTAQDGAWRLYRKNCSGCHGFTGQGIPPVAPPLMGNAFLMNSSAGAVKNTIRHGRKNKDKAYPHVNAGQGYMNMPAFGNNVITDRELDQLVTYLKGPFQQRQFN